MTATLADSPRPSYDSYDYPDSEPVYQYGYNVEASGYDHGASFAQDENRNGYETHGEYRVALPDGRTQIVTYQVNGDSGFIADVRYEGEASYAPAPAYKPEPVYKPAPKPVYVPAPKPVYKPAPKPVYVPAPKPVYKPAPVPVVHKPVPAPAPRPKLEFGPVRFNPFG